MATQHGQERDRHPQTPPKIAVFGSGAERAVRGRNTPTPHAHSPRTPATALANHPNTLVV